MGSLRTPVGRTLWALAAVLVAVLAVFLFQPEATVSKETTTPAFELPAGVERLGDRYVCVKDGMEMVFVPAGTFTMGDDEGAFEERPAHRVRLSAPFLIDRTEVTNTQFERFLRASGYEPEGPWWRGTGPGRTGHPVRYVTWNDAAAYAAWAGRVLPTEAQWEFAARGADGLRYPWGHRFHPGAARVGRGVDDGPTQVGSFPSGASPYGGFDMAGNVWEWTADWYDRHAYEHRRGVTVDAQGPRDGAQPDLHLFETGTAAGNERSTRKVIKGGGWVEGGAENCRAAKRLWANPRYWLPDTGFRCALPLGR